MSVTKSAVLLGVLTALALPVLGGCGKPGRSRTAPGAKAAAPPAAPAPGESATGEPQAVEPGLAVKRFGPPLPTVTEPYRIRTGDVLEIGVWGEDGMTRRVTVGPDGRISYYQTTELMAAGRTLGELKAELRSQLKEYFKHPEVVLSLSDSAGLFVSVTGQVRNPGLYKINNESRVADVIAQAGGIPLGSTAYAERYVEVADLSTAWVLRGDQFVEAQPGVPVDFTKLFGSSRDPREIALNNVRLQASDRIFIPSAVSLDNKVFVLGQVRLPQVIQYSKEISFLEAIARAGDVPESAWERRSFIIRGRFNKPQIIEVNTRAVRTGEARDIRLQPGDVVFLPKTPLAKAADVITQMDTIMTGVITADRAYQVRFDRK